MGTLTPSLTTGDLRANLAGRRAAAAAVLPVIAGAVDAYRGVLDLATHLPTEPVDDFNAAFDSLMVTTAAAELREVLGELFDIVAAVDQPTER